MKALLIERSSRFSISGRLWISLAAGLSVILGFSQSSLAESAPPSAEATVRVTPELRALIKGGLKYLASKQRLDGSWSVGDGVAGHPIAMTGYVLLAFMATGNLPHEGEYAKNVSAGVQFLLNSAQPDGLFQNVSKGQYMYNHGIATIALAELYGQSNSPQLRAKLQRAVDVILKAQNPEGGWRYTPVSKDADISVTVMQAVALRAAQGAGLSVPQDAIDKAIGYVHSCLDAKSGGFGYQPSRPPGFARTAMAIYSLQVLGQYDDPEVKTGSAYMLDAKDRSHWTYGNYYAAPAQYMIGGDTWKKWYSMISEHLIKTAQHEGDMVYWDKSSDGNTVGPVFSTAVFVHVLAMPDHLVPLYQR